MAKKRKITRKSEPAGPREVDAKDARLTVKTYEDVANSEDEYWANQDRIDFDDDDDEQPRSKRLKRQDKEDAFLEVSDEEVFEEDESEESEEEEEEVAKSRKGGKKAADVSDEEEERMGEEEEGDEGWWGSSKKEYYDADNIETEADALVGCLQRGCGEGRTLTCIAGRRGGSTTAPGQEVGQDAGS